MCWKWKLEGKYDKNRKEKLNFGGNNVREETHESLIIKKYKITCW